MRAAASPKSFVASGPGLRPVFPRAPGAIPTSPLITLGREYAFTFEVHVIDQRIATVRAARNAHKLLLHVSARFSGGGGEHFRQCLLQPSTMKSA